ncbi:hypothetical protein LTR85_004609 [Meristemomyces frigidus]|nr:hypothetical protein LTR85_004609 [Meristemomyces frigidus]
MASAMARRLEGKTVVVTGASSGIGKATAIEFARTSPKNLKLILTARRIDTLKEIAAEITKEVGEGVKVLAVQLDVSKADQVRNFVSNLPEEFQEIDVLVNNAGLVKGVDKVGDIKENDIQVMMDTNVHGLINMTQAVLQSMRKRGESGAGDIINIGSIAGREGYPGGAIYCATKAAVRTFTDAIRKELIATRIRVMEIDPGQVETEFSVVRFYGDKSKADAVYKGVDPLTPADIAETVVFAAARPENVVIADMLIFPNHQHHNNIGSYSARPADNDFLFKDDVANDDTVTEDDQSDIGEEEFPGFDEAPVEETEEMQDVDISDAMDLDMDLTVELELNLQMDLEATVQAPLMNPDDRMFSIEERMVSGEQTADRHKWQPGSWRRRQKRQNLANNWQV